MNEKKTVRFRIYKCLRGFFEVWDTLEAPWEEIADLPPGTLMVALEDPTGKLDSFRRFREGWYEYQGVDKFSVVSYERNP